MRILTILFAGFSLLVALVSFHVSWIFTLLALQEGIQAIFLLFQKEAKLHANIWTIWPYLLIFLVLVTGQVRVNFEMQGISLGMMLVGVFLVFWALIPFAGILGFLQKYGKW